MKALYRLAKVFERELEGLFIGEGSFQFSATPWTAAFQAPPSIGFSRQEYWSGLPLSSPYKCY